MDIEKTLLRKVGEAIHRFNMIRDGDRIAVAVSGGKDSVTLLDALLLLQKRAPIEFSICAFTVEQGKFLRPVEPVGEYIMSRGVEWKYYTDNPSLRLLEEQPDHGCDMCSRFRRRAVYQIGRELGANVIAFGHTADDFCESLFRNIMFTGRLSALPAVTHSRQKDFRLIRPLVYVNEETTRAWVESKGVPVVPCGCSLRTGTVRRSIRETLADWETEHPHLRENILSAMGNINPGRLLDTRYLNTEEPETETEFILGGSGFCPFYKTHKYSMAVLLTCDAIEKSFGSRTVFSDISLSLHDGDRLGIIGPNGAGKSTFLQIVGGEMTPDNGIVSMRKGVRLAMVIQDPRFDPDATVRDVIMASARGDDKEVEVSKIISRVGFDDPSAKAGTLSGGWRKRLAVAAALAVQPDVLLLDEPTNHLDVEGILWLEKLVASATFASIFVTHDRYFLENSATRVAEINRAYPLGLFSAPGNYSKFLEKRSEFLKAQSKEQQALENLVQREIEWLRRGAKARTSKSKARIQDAGELQEQLADVSSRNRKGATSIDFTATGRMSKRLIACEHVSKSMGGRLLFRNVKLTISPGLKLGVLGSNGSGKSTLLRILAGEIEPDTGGVTRVEGLKIAWFDQNRDKIDLDLPLKRALAPEGDTVIFRDRPVHVAGWAARFLFRQDQLELPLHRLSGGERARVHIARLMLQPADILLLDEPTNDLDIPTLEVLESNLLDFPGAIVLVTHDRFLLDRLSTTLLAMDGNGGTEFFAELSQWEQAVARKKAPTKTASKDTRESQSNAPRKKLSYAEAREFEQIEDLVSNAEEHLEAKRQQLEMPDVVSNPARLIQASAEIDAAQDTVDSLYARWAELEAKRT